LVVLPTYDEAGNIDDVLRRTRIALEDVEILVVDDGSPDGTADLAERTGAEIGGVHVLRRPAKAGLGTAYLDGFQRAIAGGYDVVCEMDADLSHDPAMLPALVSAVEHGAELVIGSRYVSGGRIPNWSWRRRLLSRWGNRYAAAMLGLGINDSTSGFRAYSVKALADTDLAQTRADGYGFQIELVYRFVKRNRRIVEIPIDFADRQHGESKMSGRIVREALVLVTGWALRDIVTGRRFRHQQ